MLIEDQYMHNKAIMVSVIGVPNAGKSSLINHFMGFDLAAVSPRPQTTRNKFHCVITIDHTEIVFVDTPGLHNSGNEINKRMNGQANEGIDGADINLLLMDLSRDLFDQYAEFSKNLEGKLDRTWMIFTKSDIVKGINEEKMDAVFEKFKELIPSLERYFVVSVKEDKNIHALTGALLDVAPNAPHLYQNGTVSNKNERFFVTEYIREQANLALKDELPYEIAVTVDEFSDYPPIREDEKRLCRISASILVNRASQRAIVIGGKGAMIKKIGTDARKKMQEMLDAKVHLNLHVKVSPKWFKNNRVLEELGLPRVHNSSRVWRSSHV